jgi:hypothetical protein
MDTAHSYITITLRDIQILQMVYSYDTCSADHICARFFGCDNYSGKYGPRVACYRRIAKLRQEGYLVTYRLPSVTGVGSGKALLGIGPKGRKLLGEHLELPLSELKRLKQVVTPILGAHHLAICDVRLSLELACERIPALTLEWVSERELRTPPVIKVADPRSHAEGFTLPDIPLIADGKFTVGLPDGTEQIFQLEVDMGTIPAKRMISKIAGYLALSKSAHILILWVVPDQKRLEAITHWALMLSAQLGVDPSIFWITRKELIQSDTVLTPIWQVVGGPDKHALIPDIAEKRLQPHSTNYGEILFSGDSQWRS